MLNNDIDNKGGKDECLNEKCAEIKINKWRNIDIKCKHKKIKEVPGEKTCSSTGCIKSKTCTLLIEKEKKIQQIWKEWQ